MQTCLHCGKENAATDAYCYGCGHILPSALADVMGTTNPLEDVYKTLEPKRRWGTAYFDQQSRLQLDFRDTEASLILDLAGAVVVGRIHNEPGVALPDVDLTPYGAVDEGVSRCHLALAWEHDTIMVTDLGSANGTYLNGQRLLPNEPRILRDNDELRLGRMVIRVTYLE